MSQALTAKYRPQRFAQVAGQDTVKAILSRASLEDRVAPAYLFSGTRGVGKTTIARIFAKALNCRTAPTAEPCCECDRCRAVAAGTAVDVIEIDGASNRGIDDVRRLKEDVGYAPMNGRYKIFIIDEAHMLSREAFNALLKTLEEPPKGVAFILATTEPHKFPATIISRCQHFVFKPLPESELAAHLEGVLGREGIGFEPAAVRLLARRGAGSVRDSMSLLGQTLALGEQELTEAGVRSVLGLAGQEAFAALLEAVRTADTPAAVALLRRLLDQGLDLGFFLRELAQLWRNLFILRQAGEAGLPAVDLPDAEARALLAQAAPFSLTQLHASWQMTLEAGRRILTSLEPALGLELLLLNLCVLPQLLSLEQLSAIGRRTAPKSPPGAEQPPAEKKTPPDAPVASATPRVAPQAAPAQPYTTEPPGAARPAPRIPGSQVPGPAAPSVAPEFAHARESAPRAAQSSPARGKNQVAPPAPGTMTPSVAPDPACTPASPVRAPQSTATRETVEATTPASAPEADGPPEPNFDPDDPAWAEQPVELDATESRPEWEELTAQAVSLGAPPWFGALARSVKAEPEGAGLLLMPRDAFVAERLAEPAVVEILKKAALALYGRDVPVRVGPPPRLAGLNRKELEEEVRAHPLVKAAQAVLGAELIDFDR